MTKNAGAEIRGILRDKANYPSLNLYSDWLGDQPGREVEAEAWFILSRSDTVRRSILPMDIFYPGEVVLHDDKVYFVLREGESLVVYRSRKTYVDAVNQLYRSNDYDKLLVVGLTVVTRLISETFAT